MMQWNTALSLLLLLMLTGACQNFAQRFASVEKVCGVAPVPHVHYLELYTSQGQRLDRNDVIVSSVQGVELNDRLTDKGCLRVADQDTENTLVLRHRLLPEGMLLPTSRLQDENRLSQRSFSPYSYQTPTILCRDSFISNASTMSLFDPPAGLLPDAYRIEVNGSLASAGLDVKDWIDGTYKIVGQLTELFSPEQRLYRFSCDLTIDRTPPRFIKSGNLREPPERIAGPGESLSFPIDPNDGDVTISVCMQKSDEACVFQDLVNGQWIAPERGVFKLQVVARDRAGNESEHLAVALRIFDATKIAGIQSEIALMRGLIGEQRGEAARIRAADLMAAFQSLGTAEEKAVVQQALEETLFATYLSPKTLRFPKSEGRFVNWISRPDSNGLVFEQDGDLILRDESGKEIRRWPLDSKAAVKAKACIEGNQRELLLKSGSSLFRLTADGLQPVLTSVKLEALVHTGSCRYRKYRAKKTDPWTLIDLSDTGKNQILPVDDLWVLSPVDREPFLLTQKAGPFTSQNLNGSDARIQTQLEGLIIDKVLPDARLIAVKKVMHEPAAEAQVMHWQQGIFVSEMEGLNVNTLDASGNRSGGNKTLYRGVTSSKQEWFLLDAAAPDLALRINLPAAIDPEKVAIGDDILVTDSSAVAGLLDLNIYDGRGNVLSALRFDNLTTIAPFKAVIGNSLLLETNDAWLLFNPLPETGFGPTRNNGFFGMQWGGPVVRYARFQLSGHRDTLVQESFSAFGKTWSSRLALGMALPSRLKEKPYAVDGDRAAFVQQASTLVLVRKDGTSEMLDVPEAGEILRLDFSVDGSALLLVNRAHQVYKKSLQNPAHPAQLLLPSLWGECEQQTALDFTRATETYTMIGCDHVFTRNMHDVKQAAEPAADRDWVTVHDGLVVSAEAAYANGVTLRPGLVDDPLNFGRIDAAHRFVALTSISGRLFLARLKDSRIWEIRLPKSRPFTVDDIQFDAAGASVSLLGPEGILKLPTQPERLVKE